MALEYRFPVESLGAGGSYGNLNLFARTSRESDLEGLWHAFDDEHVCGSCYSTAKVDGSPLVPQETLFRPAHQCTTYAGGGLTARKTFFVPLAPSDESKLAYWIWQFENPGAEPIEVDLAVDLRWNAVPAPFHSKAPPIPQWEKVVKSGMDGKLLFAETQTQPYSRVPNWVCPPGVTELGNPREARVFGADVAPLRCVFLEPSRVKLVYRVTVPAGERVEFSYRLAFATAPAPPSALTGTFPPARGEGKNLLQETRPFPPGGGEGGHRPDGGASHGRPDGGASFEAKAVFDRATPAAEALRRSEAVAAEQCSRAWIHTPDPVINRGLQWAKLNTFRVMDHYHTGLGFTNDPPQDILVVRDAAWYAMGASYLAAPFVTEMWDLIERIARHPDGKLTEYVHCAAKVPTMEDDGLNINDDTPLWLMATQHHYAVTRDRDWLDEVYPQVAQTADYVLAQREDGLVRCTVSGTNVFGIASWRNIIPGYALNGDVTEINAECVAGLRAAADLAEVMEDTAHAEAWRLAADELATAVNTRLVDPATGLYALARRPDGTLRTEVTADMLFPVLCGVATPELAARTAERLTQPDFWCERGVRTVGAAEPEYDPGFGMGLMGGIWPNLTAWASFALRESHPALLATGMKQTFLGSEAAVPRTAGRVVPGEFPEWFDGESFESKGMAMSPWMPPTYVWLGIEGLAGITPLSSGEARARMTPHLPPDWAWLGGRNIRLGDECLAFFFHEGTLHVAGAAVTSPHPVEVYDADVTETLAGLSCDAAWWLALRRGETLTLFVGVDEAAEVKVSFGGRDDTLVLGAGECRKLSFSLTGAHA